MHPTQKRIWLALHHLSEEKSIAEATNLSSPTNEIKHQTFPSVWLLNFLAIAILACPHAHAEQNSCMDLLQNRELTSAEVKKIISSEAEQKSYLENLKSKIGGGNFFTEGRSSFNHIFKQLRSLAEKSPDVAQRLWQLRTSQKEILLTNEWRTSGLILKEEAWPAFLARWKADLELASNSITKMQDDQTRAEFINATLESAAEKMRAAHETLKTQKTRAARSKLEQRVYGEIVGDAKFNAAAAFVIREFLEQPTTLFWFSEDADILQSRFAQLRRGEGLEASGIRIPPEVLPLLGRKNVPELKLPKLEVAQESELFSVATYTSEKGKILPLGRGHSNIKLVPVQQRIDALWKGIFSNECVGGGTESFRSLTPERWASALLEGGMFFNVMLSNHYVGFVQVTPVEMNGKIYGSVELGSPVLGGATMTAGGSAKEAIASVVLREIRKQSPQSWSGLIVSDSIAMSNAAGMRSSWATPEFLFGEAIGNQKDARVTDPLAQKIIDASPKKGYAKRYGGKMIVDATISDAGNIYKLSDEDTAVLQDRIKDPRYLFPLLEQSSAKLTGALDYFARQPLSVADRKALGLALDNAIELKQIRIETALRFMPALHIDPAAMKSPKLAIAYQKMRATDLIKRSRDTAVNVMWSVHGRL